jgi:hypothetical protein
MATGAWTLVRDEPALADYVGNAGATYRDIDEAEARVRETLAWGPEEWRARARCAPATGPTGTMPTRSCFARCSTIGTALAASAAAGEVAQPA